MAVAVRRSQAYHIKDLALNETSLLVKLVFPSGARLVIVGTCYVPPAGSRNLQEDDCVSTFTKLAGTLWQRRQKDMCSLGESLMRGLASQRLRPVHCSRSRQLCLYTWQAKLPDLVNTAAKYQLGSQPCQARFYAKCRGVDDDDESLQQHKHS